MSQFVQMEDAGVSLVLTVTDSDGVTAFDLSAATTKEIWLGPPAGAAKKKTASFVTTGSDGKIQYATAAGDLDEPGLWDIQAYWVDSGNARHSNIATLEVRANVE